MPGLDLWVRRPGTVRGWLLVGTSFEWEMKSVSLQSLALKNSETLRRTGLEVFHNSIDQRVIFRGLVV